MTNVTNSIPVSVGKLTKMLSKKDFISAVDALPLVSVDLCIVCDDQLLLGERNNKPAKGFLFTPGGRIRKNETWDAALSRIIKDELGLKKGYLTKKTLMGIWDHFYNDSAFSDDVSTHYVNLPFLFDISAEQKDQFSLLTGDDLQHKRWIWLELNLASVTQDVHPYVRNYANWILSKSKDGLN